VQANVKHKLDVPGHLRENYPRGKKKRLEGEGRKKGTIEKNASRVVAHWFKGLRSGKTDEEERKKTPVNNLDRRGEGRQ